MHQKGCKRKTIHLCGCTPTLQPHSHHVETSGKLKLVDSLPIILPTFFQCIFMENMKNFLKKWIASCWGCQTIITCSHQQQGLIANSTSWCLEMRTGSLHSRCIHKEHKTNLVNELLAAQYKCVKIRTVGNVFFWHRYYFCNNWN